MASILDRYGIKEVADVTFYEIDANGNAGKPVLYLDTLKVSTIEQTAENTSARGGKGNPELISWDYNKEVNVTLEDALFSPKSMAIMFGDKTLTGASSVKKTFRKAQVENGKVVLNGVTFEIGTDAEYTKVDGTDADASEYDYVTIDVPVTGHKIDINPDTFPGNYYVTGDTYARSEASGEDEFFQFIMPKVKILSENTITMEAEGDPSVFTMNLKVLKPVKGSMMELVQYKVGEAATTEEE
jgi:hypothetical protein